MNDAAKVQCLIDKMNFWDATLRGADCLDVVQVWFQQDIVALPIDFLKETIIKEGQGKPFWHWNVRGLEFLHHYLNQVMAVGNHLGKKLHKKLEGNPRNFTFGGSMVSSPQGPPFGRDFASPCSVTSKTLWSCMPG